MSIGKRIFVIACFLLLAIFSLFIFRNALLNYFMKRIAEKMETRTGLILKTSDQGFEGIRNIYISQLSLVPPGKDTLLYIARADVKISFLKLLRLRIGFDEIFADSVKLNLIEYSDSTSNFKSLLHRKSAGSDSKGSSGYNTVAASLLSKINDLFNENIIFQTMQLPYYTLKNLYYQNLHFFYEEEI